MRYYTLEQVEVMGLPAVYAAKYDTRFLGYDGASFGWRRNHLVDCRANGPLSETFTLNLESPLPDLPEAGWRHLFGCTCKACRGDY